jgi:hypothetical protein
LGLPDGTAEVEEVEVPVLPIRGLCRVNMKQNADFGVGKPLDLNQNMHYYA